MRTTSPTACHESSQLCGSRSSGLSAEMSAKPTRARTAWPAARSVRGRQQLIVYHFMFDPSWDAGYPSGSFLTDNIGHLAHLHARKTTLARVSGALLKKIEA